ncbi:translational GTPase TypA [Chlorobium phaeovibrioides]|uniref:Large ribosomal subunit assembly factor BipA n=1 Tax=Chlorobium phaeovibrioides TaxID=1094 RepID=A0A3S0NB03_CHLPH|nr:translational GTPase TypA [Chlorobium phaeovibrioides]MWV54568.1 translational GTPase TypA [Chlorobium phaeovibrioides]QEQ56707.1 translational GTPase TypA [Chlorobium phaeovibrioides]RTY35357.1 translational GTPase TypA [Chlorobium phaeovibrioides]RTY38903.1 translational GTPase TypA [Chlorobium phaeovibrioides]
MSRNKNIRNIAIIAHVDHGKTTLVDSIFQKTGAFRENQQVNVRVLDSNPQERERGITIFSKNAAAVYKDHKINIVDTPGHADFGGEVERILKMVDGVLLLVDAFEGPMPQTKFVLRKALELKLKPIVVINKIDRPQSDPVKVHDQVLDLFIALGAEEEQLDFPYLFTSAKNGVAKYSMDDPDGDMDLLLDIIIKEIPAPVGDDDAPFQMLVTSLDYNEYIGKIAIGRIHRGKVSPGTQLAVVSPEGIIGRGTVTKLFQFDKLQRIEAKEASSGDIIAIAGISDANVGETLTAIDSPEVLESFDISKPTLSMLFSVNDSPFAGLEGKEVTSRKIRERLMKEVMTNVALNVEETDSADTFRVSGRGELHLSVLIETMRREGYELAISRPQVIMQKDESGAMLEPVEHVTIDIPEEYTGVIIEKMGRRKAEMKHMGTLRGGMVRLEFEIPTRGLIGYNLEFTTDTKGEGIMAHVFHEYQPFKGKLPSRETGALVVAENGICVAYALSSLEDRGTFFVAPNTKVYAGMVVGESTRGLDITINVCKTKKLTNMRSSGTDESLRLTPPRILSLEQALEFINDDELLEVTPQSIRIRKKILDANQRARATKKANA